MPDARPGVHVRTLGCKVNRTESEALAHALAGAGTPLVEEDEADVVVVNTCTVTSEADAKARKAVRRALGSPQRPIVVVTGCLASVDPDAFGSLTRRLVVAPDKDALPGVVAEALCGRVAAPGPVAEGGLRTFNTRVMVKVQDGCEDRCAYCIVPDARGLPRSIPTADVVSRVEELVAAGTAEVVLTGVNIGRYRDGEKDLAALVEAIAATGARRIRVSSIEPLDLTPHLLEVLGATSAVVPHLHVPLQSGCDRTLASMRRPYDTERYSGILEAARGARPGLAVTTDVIAGFPGETDADFEESETFVETCGFSRLHVFRYSRRPGTPAADMADQVAAPVKAERAARLREVGAHLARAYAASRVGGTCEVLVEKVDPDGLSGTSEDYLRVRVPSGTGAVGDVMSVLLTSVEGTDVIGRPSI